MLILTRKSGEAITIGGAIKVTVLGVQGKQVKLGIVAPENVPVYREEIFRKIQSENIKASMSQADDLNEITRLIRNGKNKKK